MCSLILLYFKENFSSIMLHVQLGLTITHMRGGMMLNKKIVDLPFYEYVVNSNYTIRIIHFSLCFTEYRMNKAKRPAPMTTRLSCPQLRWACPAWIKKSQTQIFVCAIILTVSPAVPVARLIKNEITFFDQIFFTITLMFIIQL